MAGDAASSAGRIGGVVRRAVLRRPDRLTLLLAAIAAAGAAGVMLRQANYGVGVSLDSIAYISTARSLLDGGGFTVWSGSPYQNYPPLYPAALALTGVSGADPADAAGWLNAAVFGLVVLVAPLWLRRRGVSAFLAVWAACALALSYPLVLVSSRAISEPLFALSVLLAIVALEARLRTGLRAALALTALFAALACLDRYGGVAILGGVLIVLALPSGAPARSRAAQAAFCAACALAPLGAWMLRNELLTGRPTGVRPEAAFPLPDHLKLGFVTLTEWIVGRDDLRIAWFRWLFEDGPRAEAALAGIVLALAAAAALLARAAWRRARGAPLPRAPGPILAIAIVSAVYAGTTAAALSVQGVEGLEHRYLSPLYAPLLLLAALALDRLFRRDARAPLLGGATLPGGRRAGVLTMLAALALALWLVPQARLYASAFESHWSHGYGSSSRTWADSATIAYLEARPLEGRWPGEDGHAERVRSNARANLYFHAGIRGKDLALTPAEPLDESVARALGAAGGEDAWVVWFHRGGGERRYGAPELRQHPNVAVVAELADGLIARITRDASDPAARARARLEAITAAAPAAPAFFDVYLDREARAVSFVREPCATADTEARFVLHLIPADPADLPEERRRYGFDNLDFAFEERGARFGEACLATAYLPAYDVVRVRAGQWLRDEGRNLWQEEFAYAE